MFKAMGRWFRRRKSVPDLDPNRKDLVVVAENFDVAASPSAVLERAEAWRRTEVALIQHVMVLSQSAVDEVAAIVSIDGYALSRSAEGLPPEAVVFQRVQVVSGLSCAQENSRMASVASRCGGDVLGWRVLQPMAT
ncbi:hypothetical protein IEU95_13990 [Hoyosella rhizosphaerae]|uniref:Uncharacterized protein n=1 Tax=Hoyosella rhizosphaerae TaxID=1755582 RepID=A0A916XHP6_9ACTN|nr:hypothetical protein [Hoyosella rhizosphaerae]MBN4927952.1 hypothetical protein [Hoyosella rhizosphaerae]GGC71230.1 hypothetical protein GCM10011410_25200 [Hoyosella rhizosphaerae]